MKRWTRPLRVAIVVATLAAGTSAVAHAQDDDAFKKGMEARGDGKSAKWEEVAREMRAAIERQPMESTRTIRFGGFFGVRSQMAPYLPHYYLGEALWQRGDCIGALEQWGTSEQQGVIRTRPEYKQYLQTMQDGYKACAAKGILPPVEFAQ